MWPPLAEPGLGRVMLGLCSKPDSIRGSAPRRPGRKGAGPEGLSRSNVCLSYTSRVLQRKRWMERLLQLTLHLFLTSRF